MDMGVIRTTLASETCLALTQLIYEMAAIDGAHPTPSHSSRRLQQLADRDPVFRHWAMSNTSSDEMCIASGVLAENLPRLLIELRNPPLPFADDLEGQNMTSAAHLVLRLKALERTHNSNDQRRQRETLYHLAYGLSHELNNPLANITTRAGILAQEETDAAKRNMLASIVEHAMRGCEMLGDLMLIARPPRMEPTSTLVQSFFEEFAGHAQTWAERYSIQINTHINCVGEIQVDVAALREALWSVVRNAIEAVEQRGEIHIEVQRTNDQNMRIEIRDNGPGLSSEALEHCFDPFFCGREAGRGLGVGLTKAQRIIELHHGRICLHNIPGGGCAAVIDIPC